MSATKWGEKLLPLAPCSHPSPHRLRRLGSNKAYTDADDIYPTKGSDPLLHGITFWPEYKGRDGCRTPMPWSDADHGGFAIVEPWLPVDERHMALSVSEQEDSKGSTLRSVRQFINWRKHQPALIDGDLDLVEGTGEALVFTRSCDQQKLLVAINMTGESIFVPYTGEILKVHTEHGFTGRFVDNQIELPPYQALYADIAR